MNKYEAEFSNFWSRLKIVTKLSFKISLMVALFTSISIAKHFNVNPFPQILVRCFQGTYYKKKESMASALILFNVRLRQDNFDV